MNPDTPEYRRGKRILAVGDLILRYMPVFVAAIPWQYCWLLEFDDALRFPFMDTIFSTSVQGYICYMAASFAFGFCTLNRLFITYNLIMSFCLDYQTKEGYDFGAGLVPLHWTMFAIGLLLFIQLARHHFRITKCT